MRKSMLVAAVAAVAFGAGFFVHDAVAQDSAPAATSAEAKGGKEGGRGERRGGGALQAALKLKGITDEQKQKIEALQKEQTEKMKAAQEESKSATGEDAKKASREKRMEMMKETRTKLDAILTEEQKKELQATMPQRGNWGGKKDDATTAAH